MKTRLANVMFLFTGLVFFLTACVDKTYDFNTFSNYFQYNPKIAIPVAHGNLTIQNILNEIDTSGYVQKDNSGFLSLVYDKPIQSISANSVITIPAQNFSKTYSSTDAGFPTTFPAGKTSVSVPHTNNFSFSFNNGEKIDSMKLKNCTLHFNITSTFNQSGSLILYFPTIKLNGKPFRKVLTVSKGINSTTADLNGYTLHMTNISPNFNTFPANDTLTLNGSGIIAGNIQVKANFQDIGFQSLFGYVGQYNLVSAKDSFLIDIFSNAIGGNIAFDNPKLTITAKNSVGVPVNIKLNNVVSYSSIDNKPVAMTFNSTVNPFSVTAPTLKEFGQIKTSTDSINKNNSNIIAILSNTP
ncbi:MAG: hypothetical protein Q8907_11665, partial [Bacteroidota bacterium]|nr:hypothetical protein [Bacteroidota bacterium]